MSDTADEKESRGSEYDPAILQKQVTAILEKKVTPSKLTLV